MYQKLIYGMTLLMALTNCTSNNQDANSDQQLLDSLLGTWIEFSPCESCSTVTFERNNTILLKYETDTATYNMNFAIEDGSILVTRLWDVGENKITNRVEVNFKSSDTLELSQFFATDATSTTGFDDAILIKN